MMKQSKEKRQKRNRQTESIFMLLDDYSMLSFLLFNITKEDSIGHDISAVTPLNGKDIECSAIITKLIGIHISY